MAYDRYDPEERRWRDEDERRPYGQNRDRWFSERDRGREDMNRDRSPEHGDRGFFERMGDEVRSWFGDEDRGRGEGYGRSEDRSRREERWQPSYGERDYNPRYREEIERDYRPMAGDYARAGDDQDRKRRDEPRDFDRGDEWNRDPYRRTTFAGSRARSNHDDLHYQEWRRRQMEELDRDYHDYRRERQSKFEDDFGGWRQHRQSKRELLRDIREHMEVVGSDGKHVGTIDRVAGDRLILTRSDPDAGGVHHSLSCTDVERVENDRVILDCTAEKARERWRDENRSRALFEREDQGRAGPGILDRSFSGTYR
jgi:hypothetical protein